MYAIVEIKGKQYKVEKGKEVYVDLLDKKAGSKIEFDKVLLVKSDSETKVGQPYIEGAKIKAKVEKEVKGKKIVVFKFRAKKDSKSKQGHRQRYHKITISDIALA